MSNILLESLLNDMAATVAYLVKYASWLFIVRKSMGRVNPVGKKVKYGNGLD